MLRSIWSRLLRCASKVSFNVLSKSRATVTSWPACCCRSIKSRHPSTMLSLSATSLLACASNSTRGQVGSGGASRRGWGGTYSRRSGRAISPTWRSSSTACLRKFLASWVISCRSSGVRALSARLASASPNSRMSFGSLVTLGFPRTATDHPVFLHTNCVFSINPERMYGETLPFAPWPARRHRACCLGDRQAERAVDIAAWKARAIAAYVQSEFRQHPSARQVALMERFGTPDTSGQGH
jgi:hypothetical protein